MTGRKRDLDDLQGEIQELFADLWQVPRFSGLRHGFRPDCDCYRTDEPPTLHVVVELPGVDPGSLQIVAGERLLVIAGDRKRPKVPGRVYQQMEIETGPFQRQVRLVEDVDPSRAQATLENGVLTVVLPVDEQATVTGRMTITVQA